MEGVMPDIDIETLIEEADRLIDECGNKEFSEEEEIEYDAEYGYYFPNDNSDD